MSKFLPIKLHLFDLEFQPFKERSGQIGSFNILKSCIKYIDDERMNNKRFVIIDRHEKRDKTESRKIFISVAAFSYPDRMYKCKIHLIRDKTPSFMDRDKMSFSSIDILKNKDVVETTNFFIDTDRPNDPTIICEYNNLGPKISDIEYYFRYLSYKKLKISKACKAIVYMEKSVEQVMNSLKKIFRFRFRARPENLPSLYRNINDAFITQMQALGRTVDPKWLKIDLSFRDQGGKNVVPETNYKMMSTAKKILNAVIDDTKVLEDIDDFYLEYEDDNGDAKDYSLISGKITLDVECPLKENKKGQLDTKILFDLAKEKYQEYRAGNLKQNK